MSSGPSRAIGARHEQLAARARHAYIAGIANEAGESHLAGVVRDTLESPGSLTRLQLGLIAGEALDLPDAVTRPLGTALEYFHTASLLLDDLPAMDDAHLRRGRACAHLVHGEGSTILGALGFINRGYRLIWDAMAAAPESNRAATAIHVERCLGLAGVLDGQSRDLHFAESDRSARSVARTALGKTVALLRLSLVTPALLAGVCGREKLLVDRVSVAWGLAYQIADDFGDLSLAGNTGKTQGRDTNCGRPNFVIAAGRDAALARLQRLLGLLDSSFNSLVALRPGWRALRPLIDRFGVAASAHLHDLQVSRCA